MVRCSHWALRRVSLGMTLNANFLKDTVFVYVWCGRLAQASASASKQHIPEKNKKKKSNEKQALMVLPVSENGSE